MKEVKAYRENVEYGFAKLGPQFDIISPECPIAAICCKALFVKGAQRATYFCEHLTPPFDVNEDGTYIGKCNKITE